MLIIDIESADTKRRALLCRAVIAQLSKATDTVKHASFEVCGSFAARALRAEHAAPKSANSEFDAYKILLLAVGRRLEWMRSVKDAADNSAFVVENLKLSLEAYGLANSIPPSLVEAVVDSIALADIRIFLDSTAEEPVSAPNAEPGGATVREQKPRLAHYRAAALRQRYTWLPAEHDIESLVPYVLDVRANGNFLRADRILARPEYRQLVQQEMVACASADCALTDD